MKIFSDVSGSLVSSAATAVTLVGLVSDAVASVDAKLVDDSTRQIAVTNGAFGYAADTEDALPRSIRAYSQAGDLLEEEEIGREGPNCSSSDCSTSTP
jgi:hypothetical protein